MRVSTAQFFNNSLSLMQRKQESLSELQNALATGRRINAPSDDPVGIARVMQLEGLVQRLDQYGRNVDMADSRLTLEESTLGSVGERLDRVRELALAAINGAGDSTTRAIQGREVRSLVEEIMGLANTRDANGEYIFAGTRSGTKPFGRDGLGTFQYAGNNDQREIRVSDDLTIAMTDPGSRIFFDLPEGNGTFQVVDDASNTGSGIIGETRVVDSGLWVPDTYTIEFTGPDAFEIRDSSNALVTTGSYEDSSTIEFLGIEIDLTGGPEAGDTFTVSPAGTQDIFTSLETLADVLEGRAGFDDVAIANAVYRGLIAVDQGLEANRNARADIGSRLSLVDTYRTLNESQFVEAQTLRSRISDLDYAEAISQFQFETTTLQAAQQTFVQLKNLSLFNYLR